MAGVFVSYRRVDSSPWALRIADHLVAAFGPDEVFIDVDTLSPGEDFAVVIEKTLERCPVVLVLIGPQWLSAATSDGAHRLEDPSDLVRGEVVTAFERGAEVIPVLLDGASQPSAAELPDPLRPLAATMPMTVTAHDADGDIRALLDRIYRVLGRPRRSMIEVARAALGSRVALAGIVVAVLGLLWFIATKPDAGHVDRPTTLAELSIPDGSMHLALVDDSLWLASRDHDELLRVDAATAKVVSRTSLPGGPTQIAVAGGSVWLLLEDRTLGRVDGSTGEWLGIVETELDVTAVAAGGDQVWVGFVDEGSVVDEAYGSLARLDVGTGTLSDPIAVSYPPIGMAVVGDIVWAIRNDGTVIRIDPVIRSVDLVGPTTALSDEAEAVDWHPTELAITDDAVWIAAQLSDKVLRFDRSTGDVITTVRVGSPADLIGVSGAVWLDADRGLVRIDEGRNEAAEPVEGFGPILALAGNDDVLWLAQSSPAQLLRIDPRTFRESG